MLIPYLVKTQKRLVYFHTFINDFKKLFNLIRTDLAKVFLVERTGIEPVTLCLQSRCSPS